MNTYHFYMKRVLVKTERQGIRHLCLMYGTETWAMKAEHDMRMNQSEISMIRLMCEIEMNERKRSEELRELVRIGTCQFDNQEE